MRRLLALLPLAAAWAGPDLPENVTFSEHIAPLVYEHCAACHREGEVGPFPLLAYRDVAKRARMLNRVIQRRYMPPWHPVPGHGDFVGERRLRDEELKLFDRWVATGAREGDPDRTPSPPEFPPGGWQLGEPDLVVRMEEPYAIPAGGPDIYRNFVIPLNLDEDKWVTAIELRPTSRAALHHCLFLCDVTGASRRRDEQDPEPGYGQMATGSIQMGLWGVACPPSHLPGGLARRLPKGADLVLAMHIRPAGKPMREQASVGFHFADKPPPRSILTFLAPPKYGLLSGIDIPAGARDFAVGDRLRIPVDLDVISILPHAHFLGKSFDVAATLPDGSRKPLLRIDEWDFAWQCAYTYETPLRLPRDTVVDIKITYDNSADNPNNPHQPPRRVGYGISSDNEMAVLFVTVAPAREEDFGAIKRGLREYRRNRNIVRRAALWRLRHADADGDGRIEAHEVVGALAVMFRAGDEDRDGVLSTAELDAMERRIK